MKPVVSEIDVPQAREQVYAYLDVLGNHEPFTNHMLVDWSVDGPAAGVGAKARMRANTPGPADWIDMEVIEVEPPVTTLEESVGAKGRRRTRGRYTFAPLPGGGTNIRFELSWVAAPLSERLAAPLVRAYVRRANAKAMRRLREVLAARAEQAASVGRAGPGGQAGQAGQPGQSGQSGRAGAADDRSDAG
jgi:hypothetical protein